MKKSIVLLSILMAAISFSSLFGGKEHKIVIYRISQNLIESEKNKFDQQSLTRINKIQERLKKKIEKHFTIIEIFEKNKIDESLSDDDKRSLLKANQARWILYPVYRYDFQIKKNRVEKLILFDSKSPVSEKEIQNMDFNDADEGSEENLMENFTLALSRTDPAVFAQRKSTKSFEAAKRIAVLGFKKHFETFMTDYLAYNKEISDHLKRSGKGLIEIVPEPFLFFPSENEYFQDYCRKLDADYLVYGALIENEDSKELHLNVYSSKRKGKFYLGSFKEESMGEILKKIKPVLTNNLLYLVSVDNDLFLHWPKDVYFSREIAMPLYNSMAPMIPYGLALDKKGLLFSSTWFGVMRIEPETNKTDLLIATEEKKKNAYKIRTDSEGTLFILDNLTKEIILADSNGVITGSIPVSQFSVQNFAVSSGGFVFVPDSQSKNLEIIHKAKGRIKSIELPSNPIALNSLEDVVSVLMMSDGGYLIHYYDEKGGFLSERKVVSGPGVLPYPNSYSEDQFGNIYTIDAMGKVLMKITKNNEVEWIMAGAYGSIKPFFANPMDIVVSKDGKKIYLSDTMNYRIIEYTVDSTIRKANKPEAYYQMALDEKKKKRQTQYFIYLNLALYLFPDYVKALLAKGDSAVEQNSFSYAMTHYQKILEKNPNHSEALQGVKKAQFLSYLEKAKFYELKFYRALKEVGPETAKKEYEQSVENYEKALQLFPKDANALGLYAAVKSSYQKATGQVDVPKIEIVSVEFSDIFSSIYKYYTDNPAGKVKIKNTSGKNIEKIWAEVEVKDLMDYASESRSYRLLPNGDSKVIELFAVFNNNILNITEDTPIHAKVKIKYQIEGKEYEVSTQKPFTLYNRNAMTWENPSKLASFITAKDSAVKNFARLVVQMFRNSRVNFLDKNFQYGIQLFDTLGIYGLAYVPDPKTPFSLYSKQRTQVDFIQYPRDVLKFKTGDCDDLTVTYSALLENIGIETAMVLVPGHIFMMFNTGIPESKAGDLTSKEDLIVLRNGTVWIPVETTMVGKSFLEAWEKGAEKIKKFEKEKQLIIIETKEAWQYFSPVTLKDTDWSPELPSKDMIERLFFQDLNQLIESELKKKTAYWDLKIKNEPKNHEYVNKIGVIYARYGKYNEAAEYFNRAVVLKKDYFSPQNNLGNIYLIQKKYGLALKAYLKAAELNAKDPYVKINLAIVYKNLNEEQKMTQEYKKAVALKPSLEKEYAYLIGKEETRAKEEGQMDYFIWTN